MTTSVGDEQPKGMGPLQYFVTPPKIPKLAVLFRSGRNAVVAGKITEFSRDSMYRLWILAQLYD